MEQDKITMLLLRKQKLETELQNIQTVLQTVLDIQEKPSEIVIDWIYKLLTANGFKPYFTDKNLSYTKIIPNSYNMYITYNSVKDNWCIRMTRTGYSEILGQGNSYQKARLAFYESLLEYEKKYKTMEQWAKLAYDQYVSIG